MSAERRRLRNDLHVLGKGSGALLRVSTPEGRTWNVPPEFTEPTPEEPSGVLARVGWGWLGREADAGRYHVVAGKDGQQYSFNGGHPNAPKWLRQAGYSVGDIIPIVEWHGTPGRLPQEERPASDPIPPVQPDDRLDQIAQQVQAMQERLTDVSETVEAIRLVFSEFEPQVTTWMDGVNERLTAMEEDTKWLLRDHSRALADLMARVEALEENRGILNGLGASLVAEQDAAGSEGPDVEEVVEWLEDWVFTNKDAVACRDAAIRLIRAGQQDTRPVLREEVVRKAWREYVDRPVPIMDAIRRALLSTGAFREVSDG